MRRWFLLTGGLLIWAGHFVGVYLISSAADVWWSADAVGPRLIGLILSGACLAATGVVAAVIWRQKSVGSNPEMWERKVGLTGALVAAISILWQTAPLAF
jgi:hypothetical protein